jgi:tetratricopeptide (TPR) repeat protein
LNLKALATFYVAQGRLAEAVSLDEKALHIQESALPPDDPGIAETLHHLAELYQKLGKHAEAEQALARVRAVTPE